MPDDILEVDSTPAKRPFIEVLVRDIGLLAAIIDLVDNAVDGARARRAAGETRATAGGSEQTGELEGYRLDIEVSADGLKLRDNCGGISVDDAEEYAFRFGHGAVRGAQRSIGQFGVGMKRAFFKLGEEFRVTSVAKDSRFSLHVNVEEWAQDDTDWKFLLTGVQRGVEQNPAAVGTQIEIAPLLEAAKAELGKATFPLRLKDEIAERHQEAVDDGFLVSVGEMIVPPDPSFLLQSSELVPARVEFSTTPKPGQAPVQVRIVCGIAQSVPGRAGWDVLCNGRAVLRSDQSAVTGWGGDGQQFIPSYHNQFARFRGFVFFDSPDASLVPWTTTKTGLEQDSPVWRAANQRMVSLMRPVIDFLNRLDDETDREAANSTGPTLASLVEEATPVSVSAVAANPTFKYPKGERPPRAGRISYTRPKADIERAKTHLSVSTAREVGEHTFDYWVRSELD